MPHQPFIHKKPGDILSFEQITSITETAAKMGITKVRLTGGEPLVRNDIEHLVGQLAEIEGIKEICMTTNGSLLSGMSERLKRNGLSRVNISIDSLDSEKYRRITGGGNLKNALNGVEAAIKAELTPVKINMVILENTSLQGTKRMKNFCRQKGLILQKIMQFSLYDRADIKKKIPTERPPQCSLCNRIRLTADGFIKPCLFSDKEVKVDFSNIAASIGRAVAIKPRNGSSCRKRTMRQIGG